MSDQKPLAPEIVISNDYEKFSKIKGNRTINRLHLHNLQERIAKKTSYSAILFK